MVLWCCGAGGGGGAGSSRWPANLNEERAVTEHTHPCVYIILKPIIKQKREQHLPGENTGHFNMMGRGGGQNRLPDQFGPELILPDQ